jgi:hypothetical protein
MVPRPGLLRQVTGIPRRCVSVPTIDRPMPRAPPIRPAAGRCSASIAASLMPGPLSSILSSAKRRPWCTTSSLSESLMRCPRDSASEAFFQRLRRICLMLSRSQAIGIGLPRQDRFDGNAFCVKQRFAIERSNSRSRSPMSTAGRWPGSAGSSLIRLHDRADTLDFFAEHGQFAANVGFRRQLAVEDPEIALDDRQRVSRFVDDSSGLAREARRSILDGLLAVRCVWRQFSRLKPAIRPKLTRQGKRRRRRLYWPALSPATMTPTVLPLPSIGMHNRPLLDKALANCRSSSESAGVARGRTTSR